MRPSVTYGGVPPPLAFMCSAMGLSPSPSLPRRPGCRHPGVIHAHALALALPTRDCLEILPGPSFPEQQSPRLLVFSSNIIYSMTFNIPCPPPTPGCSIQSPPLPLQAPIALGKSLTYIALILLDKVVTTDKFLIALCLSFLT